MQGYRAVRATYQHEAGKAVAHLNSGGIGRIGIVYADDSLGREAGPAASSSKY